jgi:chemotaxis protein CheX
MTTPTVAELTLLETKGGETKGGEMEGDETNRGETTSGELTSEKLTFGETTSVEAARLRMQTKYLDEAVGEVFQLMMGVPCRPIDARHADARQAAPVAGFTAGVTAIIGLAGKLSGACVMRMQEPVALRMAGLMVGAPMTSFDRTVKDALGEACNMLAGTWKGKLTEFTASCMLSVPAVISGSNYEFHLPRPAFHLDRTYIFEDNVFAFCIDCAGL